MARRKKSGGGVESFFGGFALVWGVAVIWHFARSGRVVDGEIAYE